MANSDSDDKKEKERRARHRKRVRKFWILQNLVAPVVWVILKVYVLTLRYDRAQVQRLCQLLSDHNPAVVVVWHSHLPLAIMTLLRIHRRMPHPLTVLTSPSRDSELPTRYLEKMGQRAVRGSSSKRSAASLIGLIKELKSGQSVILPIDGPRGPRGVPKPGIVALRRKAGVDILVGFLHASKSITLGSWDKAMVPLPFSKVDLEFETQNPSDDESSEAFLKRLKRLFYVQSKKYGQTTSDLAPPDDGGSSSDRSE